MIIKVEFQKNQTTYPTLIREETENYMTKHSPENTKKITIPEPKFYLVYTGKRTFEEVKLKLSDSFHQNEEIRLELVVEILTKEAVRDSIIEEYLQFCELYDINLQLSESKIEALRKTIHSCINQNILKEFLQTREREVEEMSMLLYTQEQLFDIALAEKYKDGLERGLEQGLERGLEQGLEQGLERGLEQGLAKGIEQSCYKIAGDLKKAEIPLSIIVSCTGLTEEEIAKL